jgi:osmotically-inducible protein OsmY
MTVPRPPKSDREIQSEVLAELDRDGRLSAAEVGVAVAGGVVTLTGTVSCCEKVEATSDTAVSVAGVRDVANKLAVEGDGPEHDDTKIARTIRHALGWNTAVPAEQIDTIVRRGVVTLRGSVEHWYQRKAAEGTVAGVAGVVSVSNQIQLLATPTNDEILREEVEDALAHLPSCGGVDVRVADGVVTLVGEVGSSPLRRHAETLAAAACGVRSVINQLRTR